jgi:hypothetical protein
MSDAKRSMCLPQEPPDKERREGAEPQGQAALHLVSDRTVSWEWESGERRRGLSPRYRLRRLAL